MSGVIFGTVLFGTTLFALLYGIYCFWDSLRDEMEAPTFTGIAIPVFGIVYGIFGVILMVLVLFAVWSQ
jgi:hypothetical protein